MNTLLWKEFRENLKWGVVLLVISFLYQLGCQFVRPREQVLLDAEFEAYLGFGCAVAAVVMGLLQTFREVSRDRWAYLLHRGVTPQQILQAKAIVGVGLYLVAAFVPLGILGLWAATPGNIAAPWHPLALLQPSLMILAVIPFWFVGALISVREARWYATRLMIFGLPSVCVLFGLVTLQSHRGWGVLATLGLTLLSFTCMFVLTRNAAEWRGQYEQLRMPARTVLAFNAGVSIMISLLVTIGFGVELARQLWMAPTRQPTQATLLEDGKLEELHFDAANRLAGRYVERQKVSLTPENHSQIKRYPEWIPQGDLYGRSQNLPFPMHLLDRPQQQVWHYAPEQGVFLGYHHSSRQHNSTISPEGFLSPDQEPKQRFGTMVAVNFGYGMALDVHDKAKPMTPGQPSQPMGSTTVYAFRDGVYHIDLQAQTVRKIYAASADDPLLGVRFTDELMDVNYFPHIADMPFEPHTEPRRKAPGIVQMAHQKTLRQFVIKPDDEQRIVNEPLNEKMLEPLEQQTYVLPKQFPGGSYWQFLGFRNSNRCVYALNQSYLDRNTTRLIYANADGKALRDVLLERTSFEPAFDVLQWLLPPGSLAAIGIDGTQTDFLFPEVVREDFTEKRSGLSTTLQMVIVAVVCAVSTMLLCVDRRISGRAAVAWTVFAGLMGVSGVLTLVGICPRPRRVPCHACHKPRPVAEPLCPSCGVEFEPPPQNGTEIIVRDQELVPAAVQRVLS